MSGGELPRRALKRVERTFAFLDLCGFTAYTDEKGDAAAYKIEIVQLTSPGGH
jgi:hypothetical protein